MPLAAQTLETCAAAKISVLAIESGKSLLLEREQCEELQDKNKNFGHDCRMRNTNQKFRQFFCVRFGVVCSAFFRCSCSAPKPTPDPLAGWQIDFKQIDPAVENDSQDYMENFRLKKKKYAGWGYYYKDGTGQHAVRIEVDLKPNAWSHI